ncbi:MAG: zinc ribbon domain-containing protein, partial [Dolichospermum sp.]
MPHVSENLSLSERIYHCENCDFEIDRDLKAAINLSRLAKAYKSKRMFEKFPAIISNYTNKVHLCELIS